MKAAPQKQFMGGGAIPKIVGALRQFLCPPIHLYFRRHWIWPVRLTYFEIFNRWLYQGLSPALLACDRSWMSGVGSIHVHCLYWLPYIWRAAPLRAAVALVGLMFYRKQHALRKNATDFLPDLSQFGAMILLVSLHAVYRIRDLFDRRSLNATFYFTGRLTPACHARLSNPFDDVIVGQRWPSVQYTLLYCYPSYCHWVYPIVWKYTQLLLFLDESI